MKTIRVTPDLIALGERADCARCPVARAITLALPAGVVAEVRVEKGLYRWRHGRQSLFWLKEKGEFRPLPPAVCAWIDAFDHGERCEPFEFELELEDN